MFQKYHVIKSVDNEGRKVITYIKNNLVVYENGRILQKPEGEDINKLPEALQMTVKLP